jgi:EAL domain-containing protein (putative c-di-GMP-specific phosphodiesterase class I)
MINVNLSVRQCQQPDLIDDVKRVLAETGLPARRLKLEITETVMLEGTQEMTDRLNALHALGVQLGLDDFGMGYSALSYLRKFPFQTIKIDRSFVSDMQDAGKTEIVRAIASLATGLAMNVTAEGVETAEQAEKLQQLACEFGQGYFFHRPLSSAAAGDVLRGQTWPIAADRSVA